MSAEDHILNWGLSSSLGRRRSEWYCTSLFLKKKKNKKWDTLNIQNDVLWHVVFVSLCSLQTRLSNPAANLFKAIINRCCSMRQLRITKPVIQNPIKEELRSRFGHLRFRETGNTMKQKARNEIWNRKCTECEPQTAAVRCESLTQKILA